MRSRTSGGGGWVQRLFKFRSKAPEAFFYSMVDFIPGFSKGGNVNKLLFVAVLILPSTAFAAMGPTALETAKRETSVPFDHVGRLNGGLTSEAAPVPGSPGKNIALAQLQEANLTSSAVSSSDHVAAPPAVPEKVAGKQPGIAERLIDGAKSLVRGALGAVVVGLGSLIYAVGVVVTAVGWLSCVCTWMVGPFVIGGLIGGGISGLGKGVASDGAAYGDLEGKVNPKEWPNPGGETLRGFGPRS